MASDPVQALLDAGAISSTPFEVSSRYYGITQGLQPTASGTPIAFVLRRFIPQTRDIAIAAEHVVHGSERPDLLAAERLGESELYWRIADANAVIDPFQLTDTIGLRVKIPAPSGQ
ncbi:MAG: LysM domain-containing protein [Sphingomicrobium sp.]